MAAPTFVNSSSITGGSAASASLTKPASVTTNDDMLVFLYKENNAAVTIPSGWSLIGTALTNTSATPNFTTYVYRKFDDGTAGPYAFSWTGSVWRVALLVAYRGVDNTVGTPTTVDQQASQNSSGTVTNVIAPTVTTTRNNDLCAVLCANGTGGTWTAGTGTSNLRVSTGDDIGAGDSVQATAGSTGTRTLTCTGTQQSSGWQVTLFSSSEGGAALPPKGRVILQAVTRAAFW
jgi:hypothetical protein